MISLLQSPVKQHNCTRAETSLLARLLQRKKKHRIELLRAAASSASAASTYIPTHPREVQAFAMERLNREWTESSKQLAIYEEQYRNYGCKYHFLPIVFRETMVPQGLSSDAYCFFVITTESSADPDLIDSLNAGRMYRDAAKQALYVGDIDTAQREMDYLDELLGDMETDLENVAHTVNDLTRLYQGVRCVDNPADTADAIVLRQRWIMALPEVAKAVELGMVETEQQAVGRVLGDFHSSTTGRGDDGPVVPLPDADELVRQGVAEIRAVATRWAQ
ncbi:hypothetical protein PRZ48_006113 [Zasmidium cellare]|uniref:Uncharacterized protein n=1 Tax=Zasmidium cellare TaxID=395010 RepID=A0ABR0EMH7_ZASCE|nr:hypothetical protein PRZ48_006113 [Zasmidium cellare]